MWMLPLYLHINQKSDYDYDMIYLTNVNACGSLLCCLPEKGRREIEETLEELKERDRGERGKWMKEKRQKKCNILPSTHTYCKDSRPCPTVSQYHLDAPVTQDT